VSVKTKEMFYVACDECGADAFEDSEYVAWSDEDGALAALEGSDWSEWNGLHRCPKHNPFCERCGRDAGELSGERDYLCINCFDLVGSA